MATGQLNDRYQDYSIYYDQRQVGVPRSITTGQEILEQKDLSLQGETRVYQGPVTLIDNVNRPFPQLTFPSLTAFKTFFRGYDNEKAGKLAGTKKALFLKETYDQAFPNQVAYRQTLLILAEKLGLRIYNYYLEGLGDTFGCPMTPKLLERVLSSQTPLARQTYTTMVDSQGELFDEAISDEAYEKSVGKYEAVVTDDDQVASEAYFSDITEQLFLHEPFTSNYGEVLYQVFDEKGRVISPYVVESDLLMVLIRYQEGEPSLGISERSLSYVPIIQTEVGQVTQVSDFEESFETEEGTVVVTDLYLFLDGEGFDCEKNYYASMDYLLAHHVGDTCEYASYQEEKIAEDQLKSRLVEKALAQGYCLEMQWQRLIQRWHMTSVEGVLHDLEKVSVVLEPVTELKEELIFCVTTSSGNVIAQQLSEDEFYQVLATLVVREV